MGVRIALMMTLLLTACEDVEVAPNRGDADAAARGKQMAQRLGCGACHMIPGIWPEGTTGPSLTDFRSRGLIAGRYANRPGELAAFLLDPAGTAMPKQVMTRRDAVDIAAYLHSDNAR